MKLSLFPELVGFMPPRKKSSRKGAPVKWFTNFTGQAKTQRKDSKIGCFAKKQKALQIYLDDGIILDVSLTRWVQRARLAIFFLCVSLRAQRSLR